MSFSGQNINYDKSVVFFSANSSTQMKEAILQVRYLDNLKKYLELLNIVGRNKMRSFQGLKDRMMERVQNWCTRIVTWWERGDY